MPVPPLMLNPLTLRNEFSAVSIVRRRQRRALLCMLALVPLLSLPGPENGHPGGNCSVIAYVHTGATGIDEYPIEQLSHINYSFLHLNGNRFVVRGSRDTDMISHLISLKQRSPRLKVILSVGGWGGCETCSDIFSSRSARQECAESAKELLEHFHADGIDLDWEFPAIDGYPGHRFSPEDKHNFTLLLQELRQVLGNSYEVTFAAGGFMTYLRNSIEWDQVMPLVDRVNVMTYDLVNGFSTVTGHHTPLYSIPGQLESTDNAVRYLDSIGVPRQKIVIGAAFYARVWENVGPANRGLYQEGKFKAYVSFKQLDSYFDTTNTFVRYWDSTAQAPYAYDASRRLFATYDNERSVVLKTKYVLDQGLGGIMFWELTGDKHNAGLLEAITRTVHQTR
jgi:chitinase